MRRVLIVAAGLMLVATSAGPTRRASSADLTFHELNVNGIPNAAGISLVDVLRGKTSYRLEINKSHVVAHPTAAMGAPLTDADLVGLVLRLRHQSGRTFDIQIAETGSTTFWAAPYDTVRTYRLTFTSANYPNPQPLCSVAVNEAILFGGDRYDAEKKTVVATGKSAGGWFNVACAGTAAAKLFLTHHADASEVIPTSRAERQAMLKMFTADVCGDGTSFTVTGQPLLWADAKHITAFAGPAARLEAVWNERGAMCLDSPRRPDRIAAINSRCGPLPACTTERGYVVSAIPVDGTPGHRIESND